MGCKILFKKFFFDDRPIFHADSPAPEYNACQVSSEFDYLTLDAPKLMMDGITSDDPKKYISYQMHLKFSIRGVKLFVKLLCRSINPH